MIRLLTTVAAATALITCASPAVAQDPALPSGSWSFAVGAATDNRSKAISKSDGDPFVWSQAQWTSASGMYYASPSFETVRSATGAELELEATAGVRPQFAGFDFDISAAYKYQVDADPGADEDAWEVTADMMRSIGPASARLRLQYSPDAVGSGEAWTWVEARARWDFTDRIYASAAIGRREQEVGVDYTGYDAGLSYALTRSLEADLRWYGTDADAAGRQYADSVVAGLSLAF